eukprot:TRINITY_DN26518_c2_g1_i1.p1 TRINITY_DN26518_c2_g1~~TRINITY_DN26518_c2_g1_i1.p1  ORF type:complete len:104 (+),score=10.38 TRINITY_DN26518_c2_g1_i1:116-427(+)
MLSNKYSNLNKKPSPFGSVSKTRKYFDSADYFTPNNNSEVYLPHPSILKENIINKQNNNNDNNKSDNKKNSQSKPTRQYFDSATFVLSNKKELGMPHPVIFPS